MKKCIFMLLLAAMPLASPLHAGMWDSISSAFRKTNTQNYKPTMRILVALDKPSLRVEVTGPFKGFDPRTGDNLVVSQLDKNAVMRVIDGGIKWGEEFPGVHQLLIVPTDSETRILVDGVEYPGSMYFYDVEHNLSAVNKIDMEDYLLSILTPLHQENQPEELLSALAITARTNAYFLSENPKNPYWAVDANQVGYHGIVRNAHNSPIYQAIRETKHMVMSKTGAYEGIITPFLGFWRADSSIKQSVQGMPSRISLREAENIASNGGNAAQILAKAYPESTIQFIYSTPGTLR